MRTTLTRLIVWTALALPAGWAAANAGEGEGQRGGEGAGVEFGLNSFLGNLGESEIRGELIKTAAADRTNYLNAVRDLGVRTIRETFLNWADVEPVRGAGYRFDAMDDIARKASERGIEIIALAYPFPNWATGAAPRLADQSSTEHYRLPLREYEADFRKVVSAFVRRYSGRHSESLPLQVPIRRWIFSNELDIFQSTSVQPGSVEHERLPQAPITPDEYAYWLRVFWDEVKRADPQAQVVTMGFARATIHLAFLDKLLASRNLQGKDYPYFDVINFHSYPRIADPSVYVMDTNAQFIGEMMRKYGFSRPIWLIETGDNSKDERVQAYQAIKSLLHGASTGVERVNLHGLWDFSGNHLWGVLANTPSGEVPRRKPLFTSMQTLLKVIGRNRGVEFLGPGRYRVTLPDRRLVYALWSEGPNVNARGLFDENAQLQLITLQGETRSIRGRDLVLSEAPVFVTPRQ